MPRVKVDALSDCGVGIAYADNLELYLENALIGEEAEAEIGAPFAAGSKRCPGKVIKLIRRSPDRVTPFCPHFGSCGGCALQHLSLDGQHAYKMDLIKEALREIGADEKLLKPFRKGSADRACRGKSLRAFAKNADGKIIAGFYKPRSHEVLEISECPLEEPAIKAPLEELLRFLNSHKDLFTVFDENSHEGLLRHVLLRSGGPGSLEVMVVLIAAYRPEPHSLSLLKEFARRAKRPFYLCINSSLGNDALSADMTDLSGCGPLAVQILDLNFEVFPNSFLQVNLSECEYLYEEAIKHCGSGRKALDLCCGVGTMTLLLAKRFSKVLGIEIVAQAIAAAKENAERNGIDNASFKVLDIKDSRKFITDPDLEAIIADPSRRGLGREAVKALIAAKRPLKLVLIFCALKALKRDLPPLLQAGYKIERVQGVDLFPHSVHLETLVLLSRS